MKARYFCENCGKEVSPGASTCRWCGRVFTAVRCPECGFEGKASEFRSGCPACGFNEQPHAVPSPAPPKPRQRTPSAQFYRITGVILLVLLIVLLGLLFLRA